MTSITAAIFTVAAGIITFFHKKLDSRIDEMANTLVKQQIQLERKLDSAQVKEIISDKLLGIIVTLDEIKNDIKEIKYNSRNGHDNRVNPIH